MPNCNGTNRTRIVSSKTFTLEAFADCSGVTNLGLSTLEVYAGCLTPAMIGKETLKISCSACKKKVGDAGGTRTGD